MRRDLAVNLAMLVGAAVIYGAFFPLNRAASEAGWPPVGFAFFQTFIAGAAIAVYVRLRGRPLVPTLQHAKAYLIIGTFAMALPAGILTKAAGHVPATMLTLVLSLSPILTLLFAILVKLERFRLRALLAVVLGLAGVVLIASPWSQAMTASASSWFLLALLAPVMFAFSNVAASVMRPPATASSTMAAGILLGGGLVALPVALVTDPSLLPATLSPAAIWTLVAAIAINPLVTILFFEIVRRAGPSFFSLFNYVAIGAGVLWSIAIFGETLPPVFFVALAIMLAGVYIAIGGKRAATRTTGAWQG